VGRRQSQAPAREGGARAGGRVTGRGRAVGGRRQVSGLGCGGGFRGEV